QKKISTIVTVNTSIGAGLTAQVPITFPETFSAIPDVYVGNITAGGGFAEVILSIAGASTTGATLFINNPKGSDYAPNFTVKIIAIGAE
ncbi:MAG TPA: hypothetical protein VGM30_22290, partial [Puia sp.]